MRVRDFHFDLPEDLIAQHPPAERGSSRMLVMDRASGALSDEMFANLPQILQAGDLLVLNDSRVLPARLFAVRAGLATQANSPQPSGVIEVLLTDEVSGSHESNAAEQSANVWRALVKPARKIRVGETLHFFGDSGRDAAKPVLSAEVVEAGEFGERTLRFATVEDFYGIVARIGHMPLPPYIRRGQDTAEDRERYQTVYSQRVGSAAAPTAGLHFTPEILAALRARGVEIATLTLHVGLGTFQPMRVDRVEEIKLHAERYTLPAATADALNRAHAEGRRIIAVGTTTTRTLEHIAAQAGLTAESGAPEPALSAAKGLDSEMWVPVAPHSGSTSIFIAPGHRFRIVGGLLTNFHLPESTLLMLVSAFAGPEQGREKVLAAYALAIRERYRFYSYGDCMLLL